MGKGGFKHLRTRTGRFSAIATGIAPKALAAALLVGGLVEGCAQTNALLGNKGVELHANEYRTRVLRGGMHAEEREMEAEEEYSALKEYASALKRKDRLGAEAAWKKAGELYLGRGETWGKNGCGICARVEALRGIIIEERTAMDEYFAHMGNFEPEKAGEAHGRWKRAYFAIIAEGE